MSSIFARVAHEIFSGIRNIFLSLKISFWKIWNRFCTDHHEKTNHTRRQMFCNRLFHHSGKIRRIHVLLSKNRPCLLVTAFSATALTKPRSTPVLLEKLIILNILFDLIHFFSRSTRFVWVFLRVTLVLLKKT